MSTLNGRESKRFETTPPPEGVSNRFERREMANESIVRPMSARKGSRTRSRRSTPRDDRTRRGPAAAPSGVWLYGRHAVQAALANPARRCRRLLLGTAASRPDDTASTAWSPPAGLVPEPTSRDAIEALLPPDAVHQGAALLVDPLPRPDLTETCSPANRGPVVVLDQVTDPRNVGAVLRSAMAFGARAVLLQRRHAPAESGTLAKAASGALERVPLLRETNLARALDSLKEIGYWCVGLDASAEQTLAALELARPTALVLGAEGAGLRRLTAERCDQLARLPIDERMGSLNVAAAAAVALYEFARS